MFKSFEEYNRFFWVVMPRILPAFEMHDIPNFVFLDFQQYNTSPGNTLPATFHARVTSIKALWSTANYHGLITGGKIPSMDVYKVGCL
jgi:hypothetical protein